MSTLLAILILREIAAAYATPLNSYQRFVFVWYWFGDVDNAYVSSSKELCGPHSLSRMVSSVTELIFFYKEA
jgi:hypothetical protein